MTARTLEEIEALAADATPGPWTTKGKSVKALGAPSERTAPNGWQGGICNCMGSGHGPRSRIDALAETNAALIAELPNLLAIAQEQRAVLQEAKAAMRDMLCGWKMIRDSGGEDKIYGIGWDRAQAKVEAALDKIP